MPSAASAPAPPSRSAAARAAHDDGGSGELYVDSDALLGGPGPAAATAAGSSGGTRLGLPVVPSFAAPAETVLRAPAGSGGGPDLPPDPPGIGSADLRARLFPPIGEDPPTLAGCVLEHFAVEERIGNGGMGSVFRANDERLQRTVALKVMSPANSRDRASVLRFRNEARSAARLDHANIARVFYVGEDRGLHFIAFEFVTGQTVRDLLATRGPLPPAEAVSITRQVAAALRHCAVAGVVHRDVKPSNIIVTPAGRVKLVDLGLARKQAADSVGDLTVSGTTLGTFDYIAPEQAKDPRVADVRSDIYSLGCTLYHMLIGRPPYPEGTVLQKLLDHQNRETPDPRTLDGRVPPELAALCVRMMASDPRERPQTPDELLDALDDLPGAPRTAGRRRRDRTPALAAAGAWALAGLLAAVVWARWPVDWAVPAVEPAAVAGIAAAEPTPASIRDAIPTPQVTPLDPVASTGGSAAAADAAADPTADPEAPKVGGARANTAAAVGPPPAPVPPPEFIVSAADGAERRTAPDLFAAIEEAATGEVVTVNRDGLLEPLDRVTRLVGKELTIQAGTRPDGTPYRPRLNAFPVENDPKALFHLSGQATLALAGLDLSLQLKNEEDGWGVFSVGGGDAVTLEDCTVTVRGSAERAEFNALFVARGFQPAPANLGNPSRVDRVAPGQFLVKARRCLLRGQGHLLRIEPDRPGRVELIDTAVGVGAAVVRMGGADPENYPFPAEGGAIEVDLDHATLLFEEPAFDLRWKSVAQERPPLPVRAFAAASLFVNIDGGPLIRTRGGDDPRDPLARLRWTGRGNRYEVGDFWKASGDVGLVVDPAADFEEWRALADDPDGPVSDVDPRLGTQSLALDYRMRFPDGLTAADFRPKVAAEPGPAPPPTAGARQPAGKTADGKRIGADPQALPAAAASVGVVLP